MRKQIVAGNWKMNKGYYDSEQLALEILSFNKLSKAEVIIAPAFVNLMAAINILKDSYIEVAAQNMHFAKNGAYTGEVSASILMDIGVKTVILGHSERRTHFNETDDILLKKVNAAISNNMRIIFCFGEELKDRKCGKQNLIVQNQIKNVLFHLPKNKWNQIVLAYEPVWAIGTGETASANQAQDMHAFIRKILSNNYSKELADKVSILYGGSVKPSNAKEIFSKPDVDGGLIGGASLNAEHFNAIVNSF